MYSTMRFAVRYLNKAGQWTRYGVPFGTLNGALSCAARLSREGFRVNVYEV